MDNFILKKKTLKLKLLEKFGSSCNCILTCNQGECPGESCECSGRNK